MIRTGTVRFGSLVRTLVGGRRGAVVLAGLLPLAPAAHAQIKTWNLAPPTNGGWHVDDFWLPVGVPTATDTVQFTNGGMCTNGGKRPRPVPDPARWQHAGRDRHAGI